MGIPIDDLLSGARKEIKQVYNLLTEHWHEWTFRAGDETKIIKHKKYKLALQVNETEKIFNLVCNFQKVGLTSLEKAVMQIAYKLMRENFSAARDILSFDSFKETMNEINDEMKPKKKKQKPQIKQVKQTYQNLWNTKITI